jgi:hypothetical protein
MTPDFETCWFWPAAPLLQVRRLEMVIRKSTVLAGSIVVGLFILGAFMKAWDGQATSLTFSRPVALPGVTLSAGTYIFEVANPDSSGDIVRVLSGNRSKVYLMAFTDQIDRPEKADDVDVTFGEAAPNAALPITAWYPPGAPTGHRFIYQN